MDDFNAHFLPILAWSWNIQSPRLGARYFIIPNVKTVTSCWQNISKSLLQDKEPCCPALGPMNTPAAELRSEGNKATGFPTGIMSSWSGTCRSPEDPWGWGYPGSWILHQTENGLYSSWDYQTSSKTHPWEKKHVQAVRRRTCR